MTLKHKGTLALRFRGSIELLRHPLCTLRDVRCRPPRNTRFRLAGLAFAVRELNPLGRDEEFQRFQVITSSLPELSLTQ